MATLDVGTLSTRHELFTTRLPCIEFSGISILQSSFLGSTEELVVCNYVTHVLI